MTYCNPFLQFNFAPAFAFGNYIGSCLNQAFFGNLWKQFNGNPCQYMAFSNPLFNDTSVCNNISIFTGNISYTPQFNISSGFDVFSLSGSTNCSSVGWYGDYGGFMFTTPMTSKFSSPATYTKSKKTSDINNRDGIKDGTSITVDGIDYSLFDKPNEVKKLRPEMQRKLELMYKYAKQKGYNLTLSSGYRSTERQRQLYNEYLKRGKKAPTVAKPGSSRHEFGCAVDLQIDGSTHSDKLLDLDKYATTIGLRNGLSFGERWHFDLDPKTTPKGSTLV